MNWLRKLLFRLRGVTTQDIDHAERQASDPAQWTDILWLCDEYLKKNPQAIPVVLVRARCYQALNQPQRYKEEVALAYALDDTYVPAIYQYAAVMLDDKLIDQALELLALIKDHPVVKDGVNSLLGNICMRRAQAKLASEYQLRAWMGNFDGLRYANGYLFGLAYADIDELTVASEHQFWAQTLLPVTPSSADDRRKSLADGTRKLSSNSTPRDAVPPKSQGDRLRIGYWGGDYKEHSVRYFFRPLLEAHDRARFEVFIYDDNFMVGNPDSQTNAILKHTDHYFGTWRLNDAEISALIKSHELDILVDTQGHTSANRLHLWQQRLAEMQITGLAYPPTTGLSSIDFKLVDRHMVNTNTSSYYTERPLVLPESFWCFDPKEDAAYVSEPPFQRNGFLTLGCWGNAAKISPSVIRAWAHILRMAPKARLQIVSHTFGDRVTADAFVAQMVSVGIPLDRMDFRVSFGLDELWARYGEVDLILDTFPFNGGTTSCWATYAGVPVLTLSGQSLTSCMGKSIMTNLGYPEFVVTNLDAYIEKAVALIADPEPITRFRREARARFIQSSLGNGELFTTALEAACIEWLSRPEPDRNAGVPEPSVPPLPLNELLRRAQMLGYQGDEDAFERVLTQCRNHYGTTPDLLMYEAEAALGRREFGRLDQLSVAAGAPSFRFCHVLSLSELARGRQAEAKAWLERMFAGRGAGADEADLNDELQCTLWRAWLSVDHSMSSNTSLHATDIAARVHILVVGRSAGACSKRAAELRIQWAGEHAVEVTHCLYSERIEAVEQLLDHCRPDDVVLLVRDHVQLVRQDLLVEIDRALQYADIVGPAGAFRWTQKEWAQDLPEYKAWGQMRPSRLSDDLFELHFAGTNQSEICLGAVVLDGQFLAFRAGKVKSCLPDEALAEAGYWAEEDWVNRLAQQGAQLAIHRRLGVVIHPSTETTSMHTATGLAGLLRRLGVDPLALPHEDYTIQTVQVKSPEVGLAVAGAYLQCGF